MMMAAVAAAPVPVLFVLLPNTLLLDLAGPAEVLRIASQLDADQAGAQPPRFALQHVGPQPQVTTSIGLQLAGIAPLPETLPADAIVVLVGVSSRFDGDERRGFDAAAASVIAWLRRVVAPSGRRLMCICSGALIAARAGLLDGLHCTTHHTLCAALQAAAPRARVLENRLYVTDGHVSTSAGITAGIDMMLHLLAELAGPRAASAVARSMVVYMRRGGADPQLSAWVSGRNHLHPALHRVQDAIAADPVRDWSAEQMAQIACSSTRHLARLFHEYAGGSPLDYLHRLRVALARELIAQSSLDMETVAERAGFGSARHMRRIWRKYDAAAPSDGRRASAH
jgi:transcriptional regulator GlxA family with amidase domain